MKIKSLVITLGSVALVGISCASAFLSYAETDESVSITEVSTANYEEMLAPYREILDDFNSTHGTTYGFMTDEQLVCYNINREEYFEEMVEIYCNMTAEEFYNVFEVAYNNDKGEGISAENLPYYEEEASTGELKDFTNPFNNTIVVPLDID